MRAALLGCLAVVVPVLESSPAWAGDRVAIGMALNDAETAIVDRLVAELALLGFDVVMVEDADHAISPDVLARRAGAMASIRVVSSAVGAEVWAADRVTGKTSLRRVPALGSAPPTAADVALQAVELLRASLLEVAMSHPTRGEVKPSPHLQELASPVEGAASTPGPRLFFDAGASTIYSRGGVPVSPHLHFMVGWRSTRRLGASLMAMVPLKASTLHEPEGEATVAATVMGAAMDAHLGQPDSRWQASAGAGLSLLRLELQGVGASPLIGLGGHAATVAPYARFDVSMRLLRRAHLAVGGMMGYAPAEVVLFFVGRQVAGFGSPWLATTATLRLDW